MKLHLIIATILACAASSLSAQEIKLTTAEWDSLAFPLRMSPFYLTVNSSEKATSVALEMDLYVKGKFSRTIRPLAVDRAGLKDVAAPLDLKCAITFAPSENDTSEATVVLRWTGTGAGTRFTISDEEFPIGSSQAGIAASSKIVAPGRIPVFAITAGGHGVKSVTNIEEMPKENPGASVLVGYLKVE